MLIASPEPGWPQFRGPRRDGISDERGLLPAWPEGGPKMIWSATGAGRGFSSPILAGGRLYLTGDFGEDLFILAYDLEGKPLPDKHGAPLRLIDPSKYGYKSAKLITSIEFVSAGKGSMACDIGPYYSPTGEILAGYDHPLDLGPNVRKKIRGGEITEY